MTPRRLWLSIFGNDPNDRLEIAIGKANAFGAKLEVVGNQAIDERDLCRPGHQWSVFRPEGEPER